MLYPPIWSNFSLLLTYSPGQQSLASNSLAEFANSTPTYLITDQSYTLLADQLLSLGTYTPHEKMADKHNSVLFALTERNFPF
jgi:hypothetical protein